jgi:hypothetical protein
MANAAKPRIVNAIAFIASPLAQQLRCGAWIKRRADDLLLRLDSYAFSRLAPVLLLAARQAMRDEPH